MRNDLAIIISNYSHGFVIQAFLLRSQPQTNLVPHLSELKGNWSSVKIVTMKPSDDFSGHRESDKSRIERAESIRFKICKIRSAFLFSTTLTTNERSNASE